MTIETGNCRLFGTGYFLLGHGKSGRVKVGNEGGDYLFHIATVEKAVDHCQDLSKADNEGFAAYSLATGGRLDKPKSYKSFFDKALKQIKKGKK